MNERALHLIADRPDLLELDPARRRLAVRSLLSEAGLEHVGSEVRSLADHLDGYGPLGELMRDPQVTDILVNGPDEVWMERAGTLCRAEAGFDSEGDLMGFVRRWVASAGGRVDASQPVADGLMPDGARVHVVLSPLAVRGPLVSIRRFAAQRPTLDELLRWGMFVEEEKDLLINAVTNRSTIVISGGTGSGKTTLLNALISACDPNERIITVEETQELAPIHPHVVALVTKQENVEGLGEVGSAELLRAAMRMRPDRLVIGEVRGREAFFALAAMATGHEGSMLTVHARSASGVVDRLASLALQQRTAASERSLRDQARAAFDLYVHLERREGRRRLVAMEHRE